MKNFLGSIKQGYGIVNNVLPIASIAGLHKILNADLKDHPPSQFK